MFKTITILSLLSYLMLGVPAQSNDLLSKAPGTIWRDAPNTETDSELDRLNRAFTQLANGVRPAIVQIRVARFENDKAPADGAGHKAVDPVSSSTRKDMFLRPSM